METDFQNIAGKSAGEVLRDMEEFLALPCVIGGQDALDLRTLTPDLNMAWQFSYGLLAEAREAGWNDERSEKFYLRACASSVGETVARTMLDAFQSPDPAALRILKKKFGTGFRLGDDSYWATCLAIAIDAQQIDVLLAYLRRFTLVLLEFAYMGSANPETTHTWRYYESFRNILDDLTREPEPPALSVKVRAIGGTAGPMRDGAYHLALGIDLENPNKDRMAQNVRIDVTLKDRAGNVITVIRDKVDAIDPGAIYHYGICKKIRGAGVASIAAAAKAGGFLHLTLPLMKHFQLTGAKITRTESGMRFSGTLKSGYDCQIRSLTLHCQFLSDENKILGGTSEWLIDGIGAGTELPFCVDLPVLIAKARKVVYSTDFDPAELV